MGLFFKPADGGPLFFGPAVVDGDLAADRDCFDRRNAHMGAFDEKLSICLGIMIKQGAETQRDDVTLAPVGPEDVVGHEGGEKLVGFLARNQQRG